MKAWVKLTKIWGSDAPDARHGSLGVTVGLIGLTMDATVCHGLKML
jgi:hypothetical protein